jgi:hypothetical protein
VLFNLSLQDQMILMPKCGLSNSFDIFLRINKAEHCSSALLCFL